MFCQRQKDLSNVLVIFVEIKIVVEIVIKIAEFIVKIFVKTFSEFIIAENIVIIEITAGEIMTIVFFIIQIAENIIVFIIVLRIIHIRIIQQ